MRLPVTLPELAEGVEKADLTLIRVKVGDPIEAGEILLDVETEKASIPIPSPASGRVAEIHVREGEPLAVGGLLVTLEVDDREISSGSPFPVKEAEREERPLSALPDFSRWGPIERAPLSHLRRTIGENVARSWAAIPHVHQFHEADITELEGLHRRYKERFRKEGVHLTLTAFILPAVVRTLKRFPRFNASLDPESGELILKDYCHIGVAVDTEAGLIVPVLRDPTRKSLMEIARELEDLARRTRDRKVSLEELRGGTFSLSNLGGIGGSWFTPIIRSPEAAVLGVGRARDRAVVREKTVAARRYLPLCLGYDHRVIDGAEGARFLSHLVGILEDYEGFLLGL